MDVLIIEDNATVQDRLQRMLSEIPAVRIVGYVEDVQGAIKSVHELLPDAVILDLNLKDGSGIDVLESIKEHHAAIKVIVLTNYVDDYYLIRCMQSGADYFFDKYFQVESVSEVLLQLVGSSGSDCAT